MIKSQEQLATYWAEIRSELAASLGRRRDPYPYLGKPRLHFRLERRFDAGTALMAYDFVNRLYMISGTKVLPVHICDGCVAIEILPEKPTDMYGRDFRRNFLIDGKYHSFCSAYDVSRIYFHCFPPVLDKTNYDVEFYVGPDGAPIRNPAKT